MIQRAGNLYRKLILDNGVRLVTERIPTLKSVTVGIWINTGSRDEAPAQAGYSHFIEHMFFKGTTTRSATDISREIDALGGEMNDDIICQGLGPAPTQGIGSAVGSVPSLSLWQQRN
jgi:predicted Zn-dependent peptidase